MSYQIPDVSLWWLKKRWLFNKGLFFTALAGFVIQSLQPAFTSILLSQLILQMRLSGIFTVIFLILANMAFTVGSVLDVVFNTQNNWLFRNQLFTWGYWFAIVLLILCICLFLFAFR